MIQLLRARQVLILSILSLSIWGAAHASPPDGSAHTPIQCASELHRVIRIYSPTRFTIPFTVDHPTTLARLTEAELNSLKPSYLAESLDSKTFQFSIHSDEEFKTTQEQLNQKGMWILFNPVAPAPEVPITGGHFQIIVQDELFERSGLDLLSKKLTPETWNELKSNHPFLVAQYFELSEVALSTLSKFFHDRIWFHYAGAPDYQTLFDSRPLSRSTTSPDLENCLTFSCAWLNERWKEKRPELVSVANEMGSMSLSEAPVRQIFLNPESPAYRGTFLISSQPSSLLEELKKDGMTHDLFGQQLLLRGPVTEIH